MRAQHAELKVAGEAAGCRSAAGRVLRQPPMRCCATVKRMGETRQLPPAAREALSRLATSSDRGAPTVFAGRESEFALLNDAVAGVQRGESGHTVVIQGVPGAGKTALLNEYAIRLLAANADAATPVIPVPLKSATMNAPPVAIVEEIDRQFRTLGTSDNWKRRLNDAVSGASLIGSAQCTALTRKDIKEFRPSSRSPNSLPIALEDYVAFRFDRRESTIVLLVDEAQNLHDTVLVRDHLEALHAGITGDTQVLLACFGLENTTARLRELGLSRLATGRARSIGTLSSEEAKQVVRGTLEIALSGVEFEETPRSRWIDGAANAILAESGDFPHHLTNGCCALAELVLAEGFGNSPPANELREKCRQHKRDYYDARLQPWEDHITALALAFGAEHEGWTKIEDLKRAVMAADEFGECVDANAARRTIRELSSHGYVQVHQGACRPALPSLASHFQEVRRASSMANEVVRAVQAALSNRGG